jgi:hypothetical protein
MLRNTFVVYGLSDRVISPRINMRRGKRNIAAKLD